MIKPDLKNRISVIKDLEVQILKEPVRFYRLKKLNTLMSARHNLRLQFYNDHIQDPELLALLESEAKDFIVFQKTLTISFGKSNTEFATTLQSIVDTCKQCEFLNSKNIHSTAQDSVDSIESQLLASNNVMKNYRLRQIQKCKTILSQYSVENIENKTRSIDCCIGLDKEELGE